MEKYEREELVATPRDSADCVATLHTMTINVDGSVSFCCDDFDRKPEGILGKIGPDQERLMDVWDKAEYQKYRAELREGHSTHPTCENCNIQNSGEDEK